MDYENSKRELRKHMKALRDQLDFGLYRKCSNTIMEKCVDLPWYQRARTVHIYVSAVNNEVDTLGLILTLFDEGKRVVVPKCVPGQRRLYNIHIESLDELIPCRFGLMEPDYNYIKEVQNDEIDLIVAPLLAFDRNGGRLGFGGGYYDSLLGACNCPKIGLGYSFQEVDIVPTEEHDIRLDYIITEKEVIAISHE